MPLINPSVAVAAQALTPANTQTTGNPNGAVLANNASAGNAGVTTPIAGRLFASILAQLAEGPLGDLQPDTQSVPPNQLTAEETALLAAMLPFFSMQNNTMTTALSAVSDQMPKSTTAVPVETAALTLPLPAALLAAEQASELLVAGIDSGADVAAPVAPHTFSLPVEVQPVTPSLVVEPSQVVGDQNQRLDPKPSAQTTSDITTLIRPAEAKHTELTGAAVPAPDAPRVSSEAAHPSLMSAAISEATLSTRKDEHQELLLNPSQDESPVRIASNHLSVGVERIPAELVAAQAPLRSLHTEPVAPTAQPTAVTPDTMSAAVRTRDTLRLHLDQPELGRVTMQVTLQAQQVMATVGVEHRGLGDFLAAGQGALTDAMKQHGLRIEQFHIETLDVGDAGAGRSGLLDHGAPRQDAPGFQREAEGRMPSVETPLIAAAMTDRLPQLHSRSRINLFA
jgi:hypothetical protein